MNPDSKTPMTDAEIIQYWVRVSDELALSLVKVIEELNTALAANKQARIEGMRAAMEICISEVPQEDCAWHPYTAAILSAITKLEKENHE